jgi:hypothetical protein
LDFRFHLFCLKYQPAWFHLPKTMLKDAPRNARDISRGVRDDDFAGDSKGFGRVDAVGGVRGCGEGSASGDHGGMGTQTATATAGREHHHAHTRPGVAV